MTAAVILASRMNSNRLPGKAMADLCGRPVIWHVLTRCLKIKGIGMVLVAVPDDPANTPILQQATLLGCETFIGVGIGDNDVLGRVAAAAKAFDCGPIVRVTHDCPLLDPELCGDVLSLVTKDKVDYASNSFPERTFEMGLDCEAFTRKALVITAHRAESEYDREHVTPWMQRHGEFLKGTITSGDPIRSQINLCVDFPEDLDRLRQRLQCT